MKIVRLVDAQAPVAIKCQNGVRTISEDVCCLVRLYYSDAQAGFLPRITFMNRKTMVQETVNFERAAKPDQLPIGAIDFNSFCENEYSRTRALELAATRLADGSTTVFVTYQEDGKTLLLKLHIGKSRNSKLWSPERGWKNFFTLVSPA